MMLLGWMVCRVEPFTDVLKALVENRLDQWGKHSNGGHAVCGGLIGCVVNLIHPIGNRPFRLNAFQPACVFLDALDLVQKRLAHVVITIQETTNSHKLRVNIEVHLQRVNVVAWFKIVSCRT